MANPFGGAAQKYWDKRYQYFSRFDEGIQTDLVGLYSVMPEEAALAQAKLIQGDYVIDAFAGIGGSAIALARSGKQVIAIEKDAKRFQMAKNNAKVYGVDHRIAFFNGDFFDIAAKQLASTVNLDPPWGGPEYKQLGKFLLNNFSPDGNEVLNYSLATFDEVVLRVPTIFDESELGGFDKPWTIHNDVLNDEVISRTVIFR